MHLNGKFFEKLIFWILWKPKSLFSLDMFNLVSINKFQRSRLIFDLSVKIAYIGVPSTYSNSFRRQFLANWNQISYDNSLWLVRYKLLCHMTNMATMPIYGKSSLNLFFSGTKGHWLWDLVCRIGGCGPYQVSTNDESRLTLTYFMARSNLIPNAFNGENLKMFIFYNWAEFIIVKPIETMVY